MGMGNKDEMSLKVVYGRDFQGHGDGGWGPGCTKRGWGSSACLDGNKEVKGDPTTSPPVQRGPRDAKAGLCSKGHSEGPRRTGTAAAWETLSGPKEKACPRASGVSWDCPAHSFLAT